VPTYARLDDSGKADVYGIIVLYLRAVLGKRRW